MDSYTWNGFGGASRSDPLYYKVLTYAECFGSERTAAIGFVGVLLGDVLRDAVLMRQCARGLRSRNK